MEKQLLIRLILLLKVLLFTIGCGSPSRLVKAGNKFISKNKLHKAAMKFQEAIDKDLSSTDAYYGLYRIQKKENPEKALAYLDTILFYNPSLERASEEKLQLCISLAKKFKNNYTKSIGFANEAEKVASNIQEKCLINSIKINLYFTRINSQKQKALNSKNYQITKQIFSDLFSYLQLIKTTATEFSCSSSKDSYKKAEHTDIELKKTLVSKAISAKKYDDALNTIGYIMAEDLSQKEWAEKHRTDIYIKLADLAEIQKDDDKALFYLHELQQAGDNQQQFLLKIGKIYARKARFHLSQQEYIIAFDFLDKLHEMYPGIQEWDQLRRSAYYNYAKLSKRKGKYDRALSYTNILINEYPTFTQGERLKIEIIKDKITVTRKQKKYEEALSYINLLNSEFPKYNKEVQTIKLDLYLLLSEEAIINRQYLQAIEWLNNVEEEASISYMKTYRIIDEKVKIYLILAKQAKLKKDYIKALDLLNRIEIDLPRHTEASKMRRRIQVEMGSVSFSFAQDLIHNKEKYVDEGYFLNYEIAEIYFKKAIGHNDTLSPLVYSELEKLYNRAFLVDLAIESRKKLNTSLDKYPEISTWANRNDFNSIGLIKKTESQNKKYELAKYYAVKGDYNSLQKSIEILEEFYCHEDYDNLRKTARDSKEFYNLQSNEIFQRWISGKRRFKLTLRSLNNLEDLDRDIWSINLTDPVVIIDYDDVHLATNVYHSRLDVDMYNTYVVFDYNYSKNESPLIRVVDSDYNKDDNLKIFKYQFPIRYLWYENDPIGDFHIPRESFCYTRGHVNQQLNHKSNSYLSYEIIETKQPLDYEELLPYQGDGLSNSPRYISYSKSDLQIGWDAIRCFIVPFLSIEKFMLLTIAEWILIEGRFDDSIEDITSAVKKILYGKYTPEEVRNVIKNLKIVNCIHNAIKLLRSSGWGK